MTYDSTQDKFPRFPFSVHEWPDFSTERHDFWFQGPELGSGGSNLGSQTSNQASVTQNQMQNQATHGWKMKTKEICPVWNHRSSAPPGPLPLS